MNTQMLILQTLATLTIFIGGISMGFQTCKVPEDIPTIGLIVAIIGWVSLFRTLVSF